MNRLPAFSRRNFVRLGATAAALSPLSRLVASAGARAAEAGDAGVDPWRGLKIGIASYSFNRLPLDEAIKAIRRVGVPYVSIKDNHLPLKTTADERKQAVRKFRDAGITPLSCGVVNMIDAKGVAAGESDLRNAFEYARDAGLPVIVCKPAREALPALDRLVKEFDIKLAIHNHGPEDKVWPSPYDVWEAIQSFDERVGVCVDVGHTSRCGVDPAEAFRKCSARLYDVHLKDLSSKGGKSQPVEVGRGVLDVRSMLQALLEIKYPYHVGLEYEKNLKNEDPVPGVAESIGYIRGVLSDMKAR